MEHNSCTSNEVANDSPSTQTVELELEHATVRELEQRLLENNRHPDEFVSDLLSETRDTVTLADFVELLIDQTNPDQISLYEGRSILFFKVDSSIQPDVDSIRHGIHAIDVDGVEYLYRILVYPHGSLGLAMYNLFEAGDLENMDEDTLMERIDKTKDWLETQDNLKPV